MSFLEYMGFVLVVFPLKCGFIIVCVIRRWLIYDCIESTVHVLEKVINICELTLVVNVLVQIIKIPNNVK